MYIYFYSIYTSMWNKQNKKENEWSKKIKEKPEFFCRIFSQNMLCIEDSATHQTNFNIIIMQNVWITLSQHAILRLYIFTNFCFFPMLNIIGVQCIATADKIYWWGKLCILFAVYCFKNKIDAIHLNIELVHTCAVCNSFSFLHHVQYLKWENCFMIHIKKE